jgi:hypothetical protein
MRRLLVLAVALVAFIGVLAPSAMAQAPAPKVTITGFIDEIGTYTKNMSHYDLDYNRSGDTQAYGRTRGRFDIIGEVGKAKAVLGLELDMYYGQTGSNDNNIQGNATSAGFGASGGFDLNTDSRTIFEIKWLYTEFPLPIPLANTVRLGAQPFGTLANDKLAVYANGDFPGVALSLDFTPAARLNLTYVQVEESLTGAKEGFVRGEDWAIIASFGFSPFKGLDIKPMYSFFQAQGPTSGNARQGRGGVDTGTAFTTGFSGGAVGPEESRHTIGIDGRFTAGPFSFQPTVLYQFGHRNATIAQPAGVPAGFTVAPYGAIGSVHKSDISAWLIDLRAGFNVGPLSLGFLGMYTSGNKAQDNPFTGTTRYFQPLDTDTSYLADWGTQIFSLGIDYFNILQPNVGGLNPGVAIGYDKYGRMGGGAKVAYAFTPSFTVGFGSTAFWTAEKTDTDTALIPSAGLLPSFAGGRPDGDARFLGWEQNVSMTYRFAPGLAFDVAGGYLIARPFGADSALSHAVTVGCCNGAIGQTGRGSAKGVDDVIIGTARVRYSF